MRPLKMIDGKLVVKGGKLSCTCCGTDIPSCCPYHGQSFLDGSFPTTSLPEKVIAVIDGFPTILTKSVSPPTFYVGGSNLVINYGWRLYILAGEEEEEGGIDLAYDFVCLSHSVVVPHEDNPPGSPVVSAVIVDFPDALHLDWGGEVFSLMRFDPCSWEGSKMVEGSLFDAAVRWESTTFQFRASVSIAGGELASWVKDGFQNTPEGDYGGGSGADGVTVTPDED